MTKKIKIKTKIPTNVFTTIVFAKPHIIYIILQKCVFIRVFNYI